MYKKIDEAKKLDYNQLVICKCPGWNYEGFQIAIWNGKEFEYSGQPSDDFKKFVIGFVPINEDGELEI